MSGNSETVLGGRYRLLEKIGAGGMAAVFLATDSVLGRKVAVKRLHADSADDAVRRFRREAKLAAGLSHPNMVAVFDAFSEGDDLVVVMEYVRGGDLSQTLRNGPPDEERGLRILSGLAAAIDHLHGAGIVHRDIKPSNVLLLPDGETTKLTDLGIARVMEETATTQANAVPGSIPYMSPEQLAGERIGPASDIYAFALVAYEVLCGVRARSGSAAQVSQQGGAGALPDIRDIRPSTPSAVAEILRSGMAHDARRRPPSAVRMVSGLRQAFAEAGLSPVHITEALEDTVAYRADRTDQREDSYPTGDSTDARQVEPVAPPTGVRRSQSWRWVPAIIALTAAAVAVLVLMSNGDDGAGEPRQTAGSSAGQSTAGRGEDQAGSAPGDAAVAAPGSPAAAVQSFYEAAAAGDFDAAAGLASPNLEDQLGGADGLASTFSTLESIEFTELRTESESPAGALVEFATTARHTDRTESCTGTAALALSEGSWLVDRLDGVSCDLIG
jgi:serine/threonine-protein kinase